MATPSTLSALASKADQSVAKFQQDETALAAAQMVPPPSTTGGTA